MASQVTKRVTTHSRVLESRSKSRSIHGLLPIVQIIVNVGKRRYLNQIYSPHNLALSHHFQHLKQDPSNAGWFYNRSNSLSRALTHQWLLLILYPLGTLLISLLLLTLLQNGELIFTLFHIPFPLPSPPRATPSNRPRGTQPLYVNIQNKNAPLLFAFISKENIHARNCHYNIV